MTDPAGLSDVDALVHRMKSAAAPFRGTLARLYEKVKESREGTVADYIPELAKADPEWFGVSVVTVDGQCFDVGDAQQRFSIQSVSKPFLYGLALEDHGREQTLKHVGVEPSGDAFNSIVLDERSNRPFNPMINAGAIATADLVRGRDFPDRVTRMLEMFARYCGHEVYVDNSVFMSERQTGHRNRAIGHLMRNFSMVGDHFEDSLELYFQQCSVLVTPRDLAVMGATLANGGVNPLTGVKAVAAEFIKDILSIMLTCGMYDYAGEWAYRVGIPAKSGVSGGVVAVVPGKLGIGILSPRIDEKGNSVRGVKFCSELSRMFGFHLFESLPADESLDRQLAPRGKKP